MTTAGKLNCYVYQGEFVMTIDEKAVLDKLFRERSRKHAERKPTPLDPEGFVKAKVAASYRTDAEQLYARAEASLRDSSLPTTKYSMLSKIFVDILMSFECSLKSLIISLSKSDESPEQAYKEARGCGHKIGKLCKKVQGRSYNRLEFVSSKEENMLHEAGDIGIFVRYESDALKLKIGVQDDRLFSKPNSMDKTIRSEEWICTMLDLSYKLSAIAHESGSRYMARYLNTTGTDREKGNQRLKQFIEDAL